MSDGEPITRAQAARLRAELAQHKEARKRLLARVKALQAAPLGARDPVGLLRVCEQANERLRLARMVRAELQRFARQQADERSARIDAIAQRVREQGGTGSVG